MKLFFDTRYIRTDFPDGISRYTTEIANALGAYDDITYIICDKKQLTLLPKDAPHVYLHPPTSVFEAFSALKLNTYKPDVVASPLQTIGSFGRKFKLILNQQDMTYYKFSSPPPQFSWYIRLGWWLYHKTYFFGRITLNAADVVATVSETSKHEIETARLTKQPIIVVPNAARDLSVYLDHPVKQQVMPPKNLIYMGAFIPYKNVETLIAALEFLPGRTLHLLSRISDERKAELEQCIPAGANVVFHRGVTDEKYAELLADDAIMVSATRSEGFNLNLAEALKMGVPCVVSDIPVHHEVAGKGAVYVNPEKPEDFAAAISSLDEKLAREKLTRIGKGHIDTFSWERSAKTLHEACQALYDAK